MQSDNTVKEVKNGLSGTVMSTLVKKPGNRELTSVDITISPWVTLTKT